MQSDVFHTSQYLVALEPKHNPVHLAGLPGPHFLTSPRNVVHKSLKYPEGQHDGEKKEQKTH